MKKRNKYIALAVFIGIILLVLMIFVLPKQSDIHNFKKDFKNYLEKYNVNDIKVEVNKDLSEDPNGNGYSVVVRGNSDSITEKEIFSYIKYMRSIDYMDTHVDDHYLYATNMTVFINKTMYEESICGYDCLEVNGDYLLNIETGKKETVKEYNPEDSDYNGKYNIINDDNKYYACTVAEKEVKAQLKSPSSAKFSSCDNMTITNTNGIWAVSGYVDSQNSYGAMLRTKFVMTFERTGQNNYISDGVIFDE